MFCSSRIVDNWSKVGRVRFNFELSIFRVDSSQGFGFAKCTVLYEMGAVR